MAQPRNVNLDENVVTRDEDYKNSVRTLLETMAGAGFKRCCAHRGTGQE